MRIPGTNLVVLFFLRQFYEPGEAHGQSTAKLRRWTFPVAECVVPLSVPYCELSSGRSHCKEPSDHTAKFTPVTCGRPTQPDPRMNVSPLIPTHRSTLKVDLMVNLPVPDRTGISQ